MIEFHLCCILLILVILLILKLYLQKSNNTTQQLKQLNTCTNKNCKCNEDIIPLLNQLKLDTDIKINKAIEEGISEGFESINYNDDGGDRGENRGEDSNSYTNKTNSFENSSGSIKQDTIMNYINKDVKTKLMLFYKSSCPYCQDFLPIWYQIVNDLPNNIIYEEINADADNESNQKTNSYNITSVPTIILVINTNKKIYTGNRSYKNIENFLKLNGINLVARTFEPFDDSGYSVEPNPTAAINKNCPSVTFDSQLDFPNDNYMYQIFNADGQYGYATGGTKEGKLLKPFSAAYSVVDSYLSSLPDSSKMNECAKLYSKDIINFGLCDNDKLNEVLTYKEQIKNASATPRVAGTDYNTNTNVVNAIKNACKL